jgi:hypothetical protein
MKILYFFYFCVIFPSWIRIRIRSLNADPDPDPATQINADPDTDTDPDPKPCLDVYLLVCDFFMTFYL